MNLSCHYLPISYLQLDKSVKESPEKIETKEESGISYKILNTTEWLMFNGSESYYESVDYFRLEPIYSLISVSPFSQEFKNEIINSIKTSQDSSISLKEGVSTTTTKHWFHINFNIPKFLKEVGFLQHCLITAGNFTILPKDVLLYISKLNYNLLFKN